MSLYTCIRDYVAFHLYDGYAASDWECQLGHTIAVYCYEEYVRYGSAVARGVSSGPAAVVQVVVVPLLLIRLLAS